MKRTESLKVATADSLRHYAPNSNNLIGSSAASHGRRSSGNRWLGSSMIDADSIKTAAEARLAMRRGEWTGTTAFKVSGYVQCNLVVLPQSDAYDFLVFCLRNPKACPVIEVTDPGDPEPRRCAPGADLRSDLPRYAVCRAGHCVEEPTDIRHLWRADSVAFLIGSSLTFDALLERAGVSLEHGLWVLDTQIPTVPAGRFAGPLVVTMRLFPPSQAVIATQLTGRFPFNHGAPVHVGDPSLIGADLAHPLFGPAVTEIPPGLLPVFWACGVTPQRVALAAKIDFMITHKAGHGFITDLRADQICNP